MVTCVVPTSQKRKLRQGTSLSQVTQLVSRRAGVQVQPPLESTLLGHFTGRDQRKLVTDYRKVKVMEVMLISFIYSIAYV